MRSGWRDPLPAARDGSGGGLTVGNSERMQMFNGYMQYASIRASGVECDV